MHQLAFDDKAQTEGISKEILRKTLHNLEFDRGRKHFDVHFLITLDIYIENFLNGCVSTFLILFIFFKQTNGVQQGQSET